LRSIQAKITSYLHINVVNDSHQSTDPVAFT